MSTAQQSEQLSGLPRRVATAAIAAAPTDGVTAPLIVLSPQTPTGMKTTGFFMGFKAPSAGAVAAVPIAAGYSVTLWFQNLATGGWFKGITVSLQYDEAWVCYDVDAVGIYVQVDAASVNAPGSIDVHLVEQ